MSRNAGIVLSQSERTEGGREREEGEEETNAKRERDGKPSAAEVRADRKGEERERERERERDPRRATRRGNGANAECTLT